LRYQAGKKEGQTKKGFEQCDEDVAFLQPPRPRSREFYICLITFARTAFHNKPLFHHFADDMIRAGLLHRQKLLDDLTGHKGVVPQIVQHRIVLRFLLIGLSERTGVIHIWQGQGKRSICCIDLRFDLEILVILHDKPQTRSVCFNVL